MDSIFLIFSIVVLVILFFLGVYTERSESKFKSFLNEVIKSIFTIVLVAIAAFFLKKEIYKNIIRGSLELNIIGCKLQDGFNPNNTYVCNIRVENFNEGNIVNRVYELSANSEKFIFGNCMKEEIVGIKANKSEIQNKCTYFISIEGKNERSIAVEVTGIKSEGPILAIKELR